MKTDDRPNLIYILAKISCYVLLAGNSANKLTTVATGCTPPDFVCLNDMHVVAALGQVQSR